MHYATEVLSGGLGSSGGDAAPECSGTFLSRRIGAGRQFTIFPLSDAVRLKSVLSRDGEDGEVVGTGK